MPRLLTLLPLALLLSLAACGGGLQAIGQSELSGTPTAYATVNKAPNPVLVGCYMRSRPSEFNRPNKYEFCLVESGGKYAMYYYMMDGKSLATYKGWGPATIDGDTLYSGVDGARYYVKDGEVLQDTGSGSPHRMFRF